MSWTDAPSQAQADLIRKLGGDPTGCADRKAASAEIERLQANRPQRIIDPDLQPGVYELADGRIYVVKLTRADGDKPRRLYAKRLVETGGTRYTEAGVEVHAIDFQYEKGGIYAVKRSDLMDVERAKALTARYGRCLNCGRNLKAAESVERGIGPVCIKTFRHAPAVVGGVTETGGTWSEAAEDAQNAPSGTKPVPAVSTATLDCEPVQPAEDEAQTVNVAALRSLFSQGLKALCLEADLDPREAADALSDFDRLASAPRR